MLCSADTQMTTNNNKSINQIKIPFAVGYQYSFPTLYQCLQKNHVLIQTLGVFAL